MQLEAASGLPTSVQPAARPIIGTRKTRIVKKTKKSKKGLLSQPRGGPWPPRPSNIAISSAIEDGVPETFADPRYLSQPEPQDDRVPDFLGDDMWSSATAPDYLKDVQSYTIYALQDVNIVNAQYDTQASNVICDMPETMSQQMCDTSAQRLYPTSPKHESHTPFGGPFSVEPEEHSLKFAHDQAAVPQYEDMPHEQHLMPSPQEPQHHQSPPHVNGPTDNEPELTAPPSYPEVEVSTGRPAPQPKAFEAALHGASYRGGPHRVSKPRHKVRAISGPLPHGLQGPSMSLGVERSLENLRVAMLADSFRTQHEHTTTTKHHEEITAMLNQTIGLQNDTIAEYKQKHQDLDSALSRLTDKAKTNQRYVTGLQKDYEKLQKFVTTFQDQNKKTLQAKIAEIENEKDVLRREFETTTDKLARSQREMKTTLDDIYIRYVISESKKKDLAKNLSRQEAMCQEDRRKRDDLEKQLLSGVQSVQRQLGDSSTALIEKLELLQSSVNNLADDDDHTLEIKECLAVTRSLQLTPFLSTKDVQKAEGMLRFVHER
jgi:L-rhamnose mutarotase